MVRLGDVADINPRVASELKAASDDEIAFLPMDAVGEDGALRYQERRQASSVLTGYTLFKKGDVLLAKITPCMENGKAAYLDRLETEYGAGSTEFHVLRPSSKLDGRFLFYLIWNPTFRRQAERRMTGSAGQKRVPADFLRELEIPFPSLHDQRRIANILDKADTIHRKNEKVQDLTKEIERGLFLDMVGPNAEGYQTWKPELVENLVKDGKKSMRTGPFGSDLRHSEFIDSGVAVLGIDNAVNNRFAWGERRYISYEKYENLKRYTVFPGDVIITIMGTTGRSAVVPDDIPLAITTKHLATITPDRTKIEPEFLSNAIHQHPKVLAQIAKSNKGAIMDGLNLGIIKTLEIPVPPRDIQKKYASNLKKMRLMQNGISNQVSEIEILFASLSQRAFRGEL